MQKGSMRGLQHASAGKLTGRCRYIPGPEVTPLPSWLYPWLLLGSVVLLPRPVPGRASFAFSPIVLLSLPVPDDAPAVGKTCFHRPHSPLHHAADCGLLIKLGELCLPCLISLTNAD